ncbi:competence protein ComEA-like protein with helix-hairpin-helix repeat region [Lachnospiraceae bacterium JC7]|nr:competence protein ComEA-like protein with helix-hairpin-helix repeat region [Lachnospiraceae bacterium JC7]
MTNKEKNKIRERLLKIKQILMIVLMLGSGIWYVGKGRPEEKTGFKFYTEASGEKRSQTERAGAENGSETEKAGSEKNYRTEKAESEKSFETDKGESESSSKKTGTLPDESLSSVRPESESGSADLDPEKSPEISSRVNINKAGLQELEIIPGVGPATAKNIIEYREKYGGFADIEEIKNVKRIGDKTYEKLKDHITV